MVILYYETIPSFSEVIYQIIQEKICEFNLLKKTIFIFGMKWGGIYSELEYSQHISAEK